MSMIRFTKMVASGNDFVVVENPNLGKLAKKLCDRKYGVGADGLLILGKSKIADIKMQIFNADGSQAQMCGNGARCAVLYASEKRKARSAKLNIETLAGIVESEIKADNIRVRLTNPCDLKLNIPLLINERELRVNFINTGVPHVVIFTQGLGKINVFEIGKVIRNHKIFSPAGTNVNFVEIIDDKNIKVRTYERGVEDETLACGTGSSAAALISSLVHGLNEKEITVETRSGEKLKIYFKKDNNKFSNVWLEGKAKIVYKGEYYA